MMTLMLCYDEGAEADGTTNARTARVFASAGSRSTQLRNHSMPARRFARNFDSRFCSTRFGGRLGIISVPLPLPLPLAAVLPSSLASCCASASSSLYRFLRLTTLPDAIVTTMVQHANRWPLSPVTMVHSPTRTSVAQQAEAACGSSSSSVMGAGATYCSTCFLLLFLSLFLLESILQCLLLSDLPNTHSLTLSHSLTYSLTYSLTHLLTDRHSH